MDDEGQFRELFEATYGAVRRYVYHLGATEGVADDVVAETFLVAWRRLNDVPGDDPVHWLLVVPRNVWRDERRGRRRRLALVRRVPAPRPVLPPSEPSDGQGLPRVREALPASMPGTRRSCAWSRGTAWRRHGPAWCSVAARERHACGCIALVAGWRKSWRNHRLATDRRAMRSQSNQGFHNDRD